MEASRKELCRKVGQGMEQKVGAGDWGDNSMVLERGASLEQSWVDSNQYTVL